MSISDLQEILPLPNVSFKTGTLEEWGDIEKTLGTELPTDYKRFISSYGTGGIDNFLWILTPFVEDENVNFLKKANVIIRAYLESKMMFPEDFIHDVFPASGGLLPWGFTDNGDEIYWRTEGHPDCWTVVVYETRSADHVEYRMSMTQFLHGVVSKNLKCEVFPDEFPDDIPEFVAYDVK